MKRSPCLTCMFFAEGVCRLHQVQGIKKPSCSAQDGNEAALGLM